MDKDSKITSLQRAPSIPSREEAEDAVRTILAWIGEDPKREGLIETPRRFIDAYKEFFKGYNEDGVDVLSKTFSEVGGYDDLVLLKDIQFNSFCEHHMIPFIGKAHVAYLPSNRVVGISKIARLVCRPNPIVPFLGLQFGLIGPHVGSFFALLASPSLS